ncbi:hypothetical protein Pcinc_018725 [Petrolisthes cinctipes]|uniref:Uncharacterized protein n=1 Tax=Petrolisthes cinctipes TaxID=88211 RepID=A0AAE1FRH0_PETCI|nr:hypothetical protein Pcinc_018724 [Petrolisthes cinctipes]KAK3876499.1 hypothetical protein Pcinc_018725 [Petrolisthes cinctipes]
MAPSAVVTVLSIILFVSSPVIPIPASFAEGILVLSTTASPDGGSKVPLETNDMKLNLAVNQLAILHLLRKGASGNKCEGMTGMGRGDLEEVQRLREELASLLDTQCPLRDSVAEVRDHQEAVSHNQQKLENYVKDINASNNNLNGTLSQVRITVSEMSSNLLKIQEDIKRLQEQIAMKEQDTQKNNTTAQLHDGG